MGDCQPSTQGEPGVAETGSGGGLAVAGGRVWTCFGTAVTGRASLLGRFWPGHGNTGVLLGPGESQGKAHPWKRGGRGRANF